MFKLLKQFIKNRLRFLIADGSSMECHLEINELHSKNNDVDKNLNWEKNRQKLTAPFKEEVELSGNTEDSQMICRYLSRVLLQRWLGNDAISRWLFNLPVLQWCHYKPATLDHNKVVYSAENYRNIQVVLSLKYNIIVIVSKTSNMMATYNSRLMGN